MNDEIVVVCVRVDELPTPPVTAYIKGCGTCNADVWLATSSPQNAPLLCNQCFAKRGPEPGDSFIFTKEQLDDVVNYYKQQNDAARFLMRRDV